eukprot:COSAG02_NODE_21482_length_786_cov_1.157205_1_plen_58_part_10
MLGGAAAIVPEDETDSEEEQQGDSSFGPLTQRARAEGRAAPRRSPRSQKMLSPRSERT